VLKGGLKIMKMNIKKVATVLGSALMLGSTIGMAAAASYSAPFVSNGAANVAIVVGSNAALSDGLAATAIASDLAADLAAQIASGASSGSVTAGDIKVTDDEVTLGGVITGGDIDAAIKDNKLSTLADNSFTWDDGSSSEEYNFHEEIAIGTVKVITASDDKKLDGVALTNENGLTYKFVFDEDLNETAVGTDDADTMYLTIMGQKYEVEAMDSDSITVTTSKQVSLTAGEEITVDGKVVKLVDVFDGEVEVEVEGVSEVITEDRTERISGMRVSVESVGYHSNSPETSKAVLKIGKDISKTYESGDEYIGQDEDDPLWVWAISNPGDANGYVGVTYNAKIDSANDEVSGDTIKYVGNGYTFPADYVAVTLDKLTAATYQDVKVYFEESEDLFNASDSSAALLENKPVLVIEAEENDAITTNSIETNKIYVYYNTTNSKFQTFYNDFDGDYTPTGKMRLADAAATAAVGGAGNNTLALDEIATIEVGDTNLDVDVAVQGGVAYLTITNDDFADNVVVNLTIGGTAVTNQTTGTLERLGTTAEEAQAGDVKFNGTDVSLEDYDFMDHYGIKLSDNTTVNDEADDDMITLSVPEEQVYAQVTVSMGAVVSDSESDAPSELGSITVKDTEVSSVSGKNLIVIGGSCINSVAAELLGGAACEAAFTTKSGVKAGEALIKSFSRDGKVALLVAGFNAADTEKAATYLINKGANTTVGAALKVTSATEATAITA
jgi:hypothetical protein